MITFAEMTKEDQSKIILEFINKKLSDLAKKIPNLVKDNPGGFNCGYSVGYKKAILDLDNLVFQQNSLEF